MSRRGSRVLVALALLLALFAARLVHTSVEKSFTTDEPHYLAMGLYLWATGDYDHLRILKLQPPLAFHLASVPLLFYDLGDLAESATVSREVRRLEAPSSHEVRVVSRIPFVLLTLWGALLCFLFAREVSGDGAGLLAAFLFSFSPMMLAYGTLVHSDMAVSVFFLQTLYTFRRWLAKPTALRAALCGASLGLALIAKSSGILLVGAWGLLLAVVALRPWRASPTLPWVGPDAFGRRLAWVAGSGAGMLVAALAVFWLGYGGSFRLVVAPDGAFPDLPLPSYLQVLLLDTEINAKGRVSYFLGEFSDRGWWTYFPVAIAIKTPLGTLALLAAALGSLFLRRGRAGWLLGIPAGVVLGMACFWLDIPLGLRYALPVYPIGFVFVATQVMPVRGRLARAGVALACAALALSSARIHPHYLAYFNEAVGGPLNGPRYLLESNIDWGQDLSTLARYLEERGNPPVWLEYFGGSWPRSWGIRHRPLPRCTPVSGVVAISVNVMEGLYSARNPFARPPADCYAWLRELEPVATPGYSIRVYDVPADARRVPPPPR